MSESRPKRDGRPRTSGLLSPIALSCTSLTHLPYDRSRGMSNSERPMLSPLCSADAAGFWKY